MIKAEKMKALPCPIAPIKPEERTEQDFHESPDNGLSLGLFLAMNFLASEDAPLALLNTPADDGICFRDMITEAVEWCTDLESRTTDLVGPQTDGPECVFNLALAFVDMPMRLFSRK